MHTNNPLELINNHLPLIASWIDELERKPEIVKSIEFNYNPQRDYKREIEENSHWKLYKIGDKITITLVFTDDMIETRSFDRNEWNSQFKTEA